MQPSDFLLSLCGLHTAQSDTAAFEGGAALMRKGGPAFAVAVSLDLSFEFCISPLGRTNGSGATQVGAISFYRRFQRQLC